MTHVPFGTLVDYVRGLGGSGARESVRLHLSACARCTGAAARLSRFAAIARATVDAEPPDDVVRSGIALFGALRVPPPVPDVQPPAVVSRSATAAASAGGYADSAHDYAGTWTSERSGTTVVRLELAEAGGDIEGCFGVGDFRVDVHGDSWSTGPASAPEPLADVSFCHGTLFFAHRQGDDVNQYQVCLLSADTARLTVVLPDTVRRELAREGIPGPPPILLRRAPRR